MTAETQELDPAADSTADEHAAPAEHHDEEHNDHPTQGQYWIIALILAVVTAVEIAVPSIEALDGAPGIFLLFALGAVKFGMVVALFMHLKFERPLFKMLFLIGLAGALAMFIVVLLTFRAL